MLRAIFSCLLAPLLYINASQVCYKDIGCFSNAHPFNNAFGKLPLSPDHIGTAFHLHTRQNPIHGILLNASTSLSQLTVDHFNGQHKTVFIVHGFHGEENDDWMIQMTAALLNHSDMNVIVVTWTKGAFDDYSQAVANTRVVGALIAHVVKSLHQVGSINYGNVHLIGHSLGAHICGYAGERLPGLGRITGLDPAGPEFNKVGTHARLDPSDAKFVDVIHTDGLLGFGRSLGHVDFFPNGGTAQRGCLNDPIAPVYSCSHMRSAYYFTESINDKCNFYAHPCRSHDDWNHWKCIGCGHGCQTMGYRASSQAHGTYYLLTNYHYPYCAGLH